MSNEERPIIEEVMDYVVYAPVGLALTIIEDLPSLVERGKSVLASQVGVFRFAGKLAFGQLRKGLDGILAPSSPDVTDAFGHEGPPPPPSGKSPAKTGRVVTKVATSDDRQSPGPGPAIPELAIPNYDTLAASQIVARLGGLDSDELRAVRRHEEQHRGRRTILARINQLEQGHHPA